MFVCATYNDVVQQMPVLGSWMHPSSLLSISQLEQCIGNREVKFGTCFQEPEPIAIDVAAAVSSDNSAPNIVITPYTSVKVTQNGDSVTGWYGPECGVKCCVKIVFCRPYDV